MPPDVWFWGAHLPAINWHEEAACGVLHRRSRNLIRTYVAMRYRKEADRTTDFMGTLMAGLSPRREAGIAGASSGGVLLAGDIAGRLLPVTRRVSKPESIRCGQTEEQ